MWAEGHSTTKIGEALGVSANAVCGRMYRMRARGDDLQEPKEKQPNGRTRRARKPPSRGRDTDASIIEPSVGVSIMGLEPWHCRSVMPRKPEDEMPVYCGALKRGGSSYCAGHHQLYYRAGQAPA